MFNKYYNNNRREYNNINCRSNPSVNCVYYRNNTLSPIQIPSYPRGFGPAIILSGSTYPITNPNTPITTVKTWSSEPESLGNIMYNVTGGYFTIPANGIYSIVATGRITGQTITNQNNYTVTLQIYIIKNGYVYFLSMNQFVAEGYNLPINLNTTAQLSLNSGDSIFLAITQDIGSPVTLDSGATISIASLCLFFDNN